jgi:hypothetical protein
LITAMTILLPLVLFAAQEHGVRFDDTATAAGVLHDGWGRGDAIADFDQDGLLDIYSTSVSSPDGLFRQDPTNPGTFIDMTVPWGIQHDTRGEGGVVAVDFDNDGDLDLFLPCGGNSGYQRDKLFRNDLNTLGTFTDVIAAGGGGILQVLNTTSFGASALDYDADGDLDLFLGNNMHDVPSVVYPPNTLLRNEGGFAFSDVSAAMGITHTGDFRHSGAADFDNDGWIDIGVSDFVGESLLYKNVNGNSFIEVHAPVGFISPDNNFGVMFEDLNNDGWLDIVAPRFRIWSRWFLNNGDGTFRDVTADVGGKSVDVMGHNCGDLDMDGYPEVWIGTGHSASVQKDVMYLTHPWANTVKAYDYSKRSGITSKGLTRSHGGAIGDINGDLFPDIYFNNGGPPSYPNSNQTNSLFISRGNTNHILKVTLEGKKMNRFGFGSKICLFMPGGRSIHKTIQAGKGFSNTDEPAAYFGLGADTAVDYVQVVWPNGAFQRVLAPAVDTTVHFVETAIKLSGAPALGGSMHIEAVGPALDNVTLFYATNPDFLISPTYGGVLELSQPMISLAAFSLDAAGLYAGQFTLPSDPNLSGTTIYVQAFFENLTTGHKGLSVRKDIAIP